MSEKSTILPSELIKKHFPFNPTKGQESLFNELNDFILQRNKKDTFLLKGYAGTGKTSTISALTSILRNYNLKPILMAPTGRAAKVMANYSKRKAFTIHKIIFKQAEDPSTGKLRFIRQKNYYKNTLFIVDEASMVNDSIELGNKGLLTELLNFIFEDNLANNKLMFIGDIAQLPPVNQEMSPALEQDYLQDQFNLKITPHLLSEVTRQNQQSGILSNATSLRLELDKNLWSIKLRTKGYPDVFKMTTEKLEDGLRYAYDKYGVENTGIICRSNKSATMYNKYIRQQINYAESEIDAGDILMIVRNNYTWLDEESEAGFLANGEFVEVTKVGNIEEEYGFRFAGLRLRLIDYPNHEPINVKVHLKVLHSYSPALTREESMELYENVIKENGKITKKQRTELLQKDPYLNALQIKYAYALTCHKSQGGQWDIIFVDMGYFAQEPITPETIRWLYTAITRASKELYFVNFPNNFFD